MTLWIWFGLFLVLAVATAEKGQPTTILSAASVAIYALQLEYSNKFEVCPQKHSREWILCVMYVTSLILAAISVYVYSLKGV